MRHHMTNRMKSAFYRLTATRDLSHVVHRLESLQHRLPSPRSRFAIPFVLRGRGFFRSIRPRQNPIEIERLYCAICDQLPRRVLEIGTAKGGTLYLWTQAASEDATIVSLDLPEGQFGGGYPEARIPFYQAFARPEQTLVLLRDDSHTKDSLEVVRKHFDDQPIDFAFIDGDHTYDGVRRDVAMYGPLVRPGGIIAFHDILPQPESPQTQVHRLWNELRSHHEVQEFIATDSPRQIGIGLLRVPDGGFMYSMDGQDAATSRSSDASSFAKVASSE